MPPPAAVPVPPTEPSGAATLLSRPQRQARDMATRRPDDHVEDARQGRDGCTPRSRSCDVRRCSWLRRRQPCGRVRRCRGGAAASHRREGSRARRWPPTSPACDDDAHAPRGLDRLLRRCRQRNPRCRFQRSRGATSSAPAARRTRRAPGRRPTRSLASLASGNLCGGPEIGPVGGGHQGALYAEDILGSGANDIPDGARAGWTFTAPAGATITAVSYYRALASYNDSDLISGLFDATGAPLEQCKIPWPFMPGDSITCSKPNNQVAAGLSGLNTTGLFFGVRCKIVRPVLACGAGAPFTQPKQIYTRPASPWPRACRRSSRTSEAAPGAEGSSVAPCP